MTKIVEIDNCSHCPFVTIPYTALGRYRGYYCQHPKRAVIIPIPSHGLLEDCPLDSKDDSELEFELNSNETPLASFEKFIKTVPNDVTSYTYDQLKIFTFQVRDRKFQIAFNTKEEYISWRDIEVPGD
jgi:hypothetical protein